MDGSGRSTLQLREQLCFALHAASRAMTGCYRPLLDEIGLTYTQYVAMLVLWEHGPVTFGFLGDELRLDSGSLSPVVKRLEAHGLVTRRRRPSDERTVEVACTPAGDALEVRAVQVQHQVERGLGLTATELAEMRDDLHRLTERLRRSDAPDPVSR